jgi:hypothetical protein
LSLFALAFWSVPAELFMFVSLDWLSVEWQAATSAMPRSGRRMDFMGVTGVEWDRAG